MSHRTATVRARIVGRPKKNPGQPGPGSVNVKINALIAKKARVLAASGDQPLSDFLDGMLAELVETKFSIWRDNLRKSIQEADREHPSWRQDLVQMLGELQANNIDFHEMWRKHLADPKLSPEEREKALGYFKAIQADHLRYIDENLLESIESNGEYGDEASMQKFEQKFFKKGSSK